MFPRTAGVLLHPTSLPSTGGIGDLGPDALRFADWLRDAGMTIWQMLPLGPTGYGDSPYQCFSAFAGNPLLIHIPDSAPAPPHERASTPSSAHHCDFGAVIPDKRRRLDAWLDSMPFDEETHAFVEAERNWLPDYALFMALKAKHGGAPWTQWESGAAQRDPETLKEASVELHAAIVRCYKEQQRFAEQFRMLRTACRERGIQLMGDVPIYVAHDSADVWANRALFQLCADGTLQAQAGVPPDYFSATGQLWGNPLYNWERLREEGFAWWIARMRSSLAMFDLVRLDHFRGFDEYWEVPGADVTAMHGQWVRGPGSALFTALTDALGPLPVVAENLGMITPSVEALRAQFAYPGMAILQFAFDAPTSDFLPHRFERDLVVYTGTHDNDTTMGWWTAEASAGSTQSSDEIAERRARALRYLDTDGRDMPWTMMRAALASVANTVIVPMQDVLSLPSDARMNLPGREVGNWSFRFSWEQLTPNVTTRLRQLVSSYERNPR